MKIDYIIKNLPVENEDRKITKLNDGIYINGSNTIYISYGLGGGGTLLNFGDIFEIKNNTVNIILYRGKETKKNNFQKFEYITGFILPYNKSLLTEEIEAPLAKYLYFMNTFYSDWELDLGEAYNEKLNKLVKEISGYDGDYDVFQ